MIISLQMSSVDSLNSACEPRLPVKTVEPLWYQVVHQLHIRRGLAGARATRRAVLQGYIPEV